MKITVITCTYNAANEIERTLASVAGQTHPDIEHLIIDGQSADSTVAMARAYADRTDRPAGHQVVVTSEPDRGLYDAMNKGIARATGTYIIFMNAGDTFAAPTTLSTVAQAAQASPVLPGVIYGDTDVVDADGHFVRHRRLSPPEHLSWRSFSHGMLVCHQAFYARTDLAQGQPYDLRYRYSADVDWCIRVMKAAQRAGVPLVNTHAVVAHFLDGGMTSRYHRRSLCERFRVMCVHYGVLPTVARHVWFAIRSVVKR